MEEDELGLGIFEDLDVLLRAVAHIYGQPDDARAQNAELAAEASDRVRRPGRDLGLRAQPGADQRSGYAVAARDGILIGDRPILVLRENLAGEIARAPVEKIDKPHASLPGSFR